jgi:hypothetical protein
MPMHERRGTEEPREFSGESGCRHLLKWLNGNENDLARRRIRQLLRNFQIVSMNWIEVRDVDGEVALKYAGSRDAYQRALGEIFGLLRRYKFSPVIWNFGPRLINQWIPRSGPAGKFERRWPPADGQYDDVQAIYELTWLTGDKGIKQIKECDCGKWFFRRFAHQKFCCAKCRDKANKSSPEWQEYRRHKAREYYWLHRTRNVS